MTTQQRRAAKVINFGIIYGMSAFGLAQNLGIPHAPKRNAFIDAYLGSATPSVGALHGLDPRAPPEERGQGGDPLRPRPLAARASRAKNHGTVRENAKRMAINARIQGTAADLLKKAMIAIHRRLLEEQPETHLILTVHDELVFEVPDADLEAVSQLAQTEMESVDDLRVPLVVDLGHGRTWYDART